jgi:hypothetical protein
LSFGSPQKSP